MTTPAHSTKPQLISGIDIRKLPIGPQEAFVLSRIDGTVTAREIGYATSLSEAQVEDCLNRLVSLGAIQYSGRPTNFTHSQTQVKRGTTTAQVTEPAANGWQTEGTATSPKNDPAELEAPSVLDATRRREILDLFNQLESLDHYQLLGIERGAERRAVKAAYYEKVKTFHPDRYFGRDLGPLRSQLEQCFARLTAAHDTLASAESRQEYDAYLKDQNETQELERALAQSVTVDDLERLEQQMRLALDGQTSSSALLQSLSASSADPPSSTVLDLAAMSEPAESNPAARMSDDERRRFLARKLRVSSASLRAAPRLSSPPTPRPSPPPSREQIAEQLRRQLGGSRRDEQARQLESHMAAAQGALAANDPVAASNALRAAQSLAPSDPAIAEQLVHAQALAAATLADTYLRQAEYEEKSGRFDAAARSYERAARGKPSFQAWEAAARCLLEAQVDLRSAAEFAKSSINLAPERPASHLLLGRIFLVAGMRTSALTELERARRLDPNNDTVLSLLKRIANGEI